MIKISNLEDILDSRDIEERILELDSIREFSDVYQLEYDILNEFKDDVCNYVDPRNWDYGITFIRGTHFEEYTKDFCYEVGYIRSDHESWIVIDWAETSKNLSMDYSSIYLDGVEYLYVI